VTLERFLQISDSVLDSPAVNIANLGTMFGKRFLGGMHQRLGMILGLDRGPALLVLFGVRFCVFDHLFDVGFGQATRSLDAYLLLLASGFVFCLHVYDAVRVDVEGNLDLWHAAWRRRNSDQIELTKHLVVSRHLALALEHADGDRVLIVLGG